MRSASFEGHARCKTSHAEEGHSMEEVHEEGELRCALPIPIRTSLLATTAAGNVHGTHQLQGFASVTGLQFDAVHPTYHPAMSTECAWRGVHCMQPFEDGGRVRQRGDAAAPSLSDVSARLTLAQWHSLAQSTRQSTRLRVDPTTPRLRNPLRSQELTLWLGCCSRREQKLTEFKQLLKMHQEMGGESCPPSPALMDSYHGVLSSPPAAVAAAQRGGGETYGRARPATSRPATARQSTTPISASRPRHSTAHTAPTSSTISYSDRTVKNSTKRSQWTPDRSHRGRTPPSASSQESHRPGSAAGGSLQEAERQQVFDRLYASAPHSTTYVHPCLMVSLRLHFWFSHCVHAHSRRTMCVK